MIRKKLYILIALIISSLAITYIINLTISARFEKIITERTVKAIYDTIGRSTTRRIDVIIETLSEDLKGRGREDQILIIRTFFTRYKHLRFDKFTEIITDSAGVPLFLQSTDSPDINMDMQNALYREFIAKFQKLKNTGGGYKFYGHGTDSSTDRMIYAGHVPETDLWFCIDIDMKEYIRSIESVFLPLSELNTIHRRIIHIITILVLLFIILVSLHIGRQIAEIDRERKAQSRSLHKANNLLEIEVNIRKQIEQELKETNRELKLISSKDGLTGIANRRYYDEYMTTEWERMARENKPISLLMCDIDYFKKYNDAYGHLEGDSCLRMVAEAINKCCKRPADLAARYGGEEFTVVLPDTNLEGAKLVAESIRTGIIGLGIEHYDSPEKKVTVSIGAASVIPHHGGNPAELARSADSALYQAKNNGRNRIEP